MAMKTLCVVMARAGSKGLPGKNAVLLAGKPMVAWTVEHACASRRVDRVVLSTDGEAIAAVGRGCGVEVVRRPAELASDTATVDSAVRHAVEEVEKRHGAVVILYGNVPVRPAGLVDRAVEKLISSGAESVQSVCPVGKSHPYWMKLLVGVGGDELKAYEENRVYRRQDLPGVYQLDGGVIAVTRESLFRVVEGEPHAFLGKDRRAVVTGPGDVVDVDVAMDLEVARAVLTGRGNATRGEIRIGDRAVGDGGRAYVIAELGVNHDGSLGRALELTRMAKRAGADGVKLQLFDAGLLLSDSAMMAGYQKGCGDDPYAMLMRLQLTGDQMRAVREEARGLGMGFIVTCFSVELVREMRGLDVDAVKVASPDAVNLPLVEALLGLGKPMLISTGACELEELGGTVAMCGSGSAVLMQCVSAYPVAAGCAAVGGMDDLRRLCERVGYSDHTTDVRTGMLAVARGACVIEKHLTYDRVASGPDHAASFDEGQFGEYVRLIRLAEEAVGSGGKRVLGCERDVRTVSRQSVCVVRGLSAGHVLRREDVTVKRPGTGIAAARLGEVVGKALRRSVAGNQILVEGDVSGL
jgi:sialic acid synthase SpsE/CMP-N-acetylneuraminic acid synthetase